MKNLKLILALTVGFLTLVSMTGCSATHIGASAKLAPIAAGHPEPKVVFMGDSITYNYGQSWASTAFAQHPTWNDQGLVGQNSLQMANRFNDDVVSQHPAVVVTFTLVGSFAGDLPYTIRATTSKPWFNSLRLRAFNLF
jgi:hypothetical protein